MRARLLTATLALGLVFASGCIIRSGASSSTPSSGDISSANVGAGTDPAFVVRNNSGQTICYVRISPASSSQWGPDRLGSSETIAPGQSRGWRVATGNYDIRLEDCSNNQLDDQRNVPIAGEGVMLTYQ